MPAVALTDTHNMFGALEFATSCADLGIQPLVGAQVRMYVPGEYGKEGEFSELTLLCQNEAGYQNLMALMSESYTRMDGIVLPHITLSQLREKSTGLISLNGGEGSDILSLLHQNKEDAARAQIKVYQEIFGERFYLECNRFHPTEDSLKLEGVKVEAAQAFGIPLLATNNVFFEDKGMYKAHDALLCIAEGRYVNEVDRRKVTPEHYFKSGKEMTLMFPDLPEALQNTIHLAKRCHFMPRGRKPILPSFDCKGRSEDEEIVEQALLGLKERLKDQDEIPQHYLDRLKYELDIIKTMGFSGYFLIVADFIKYAKSKDIPVGPGRGSGAGSLVAWVLTITDMDPIRFGLIFERFLNPERVSMPDFDVDFCQDRRDEVIDYVKDKYGADRVAHIITFGKLQARAVLRDVGRVLQMPYGQVDKITKLIPNNPANPITLEEALIVEPALKEAQQNDESVRELIEVGIQLEGLYRHASKHAAGIVIADRPTQELVPLYVDEVGGLPATQFSMKYAEMAGLVKFDFLGLKTLTVIKRCCEFIADRGISVKIEDIPLDDQKTFDLLQRVETMGIFQLESGGMREVLRKLKPDRFEDIVALVALFRPGPMDDIPRYLACKHGEEEVTYLHPDLEPILKDSYGVMVYQEQVMHIAQKLGGYSLGAADLLRRAMGKKIKEEMDDQRGRFVSGAVEYGVKEEIAHQIFDQMAKFAGYGFNKSHSAPYALLAYQTAYLKANYPAEFFAASMTYDMHNTDKLNMFRTDMTKLGLALLPPDINKSFPHFAVEGKAVRYGLAAIKNVGDAAMQTIIEARQKGGAFKSPEDFIDRFDHHSVNKRQLEHLIGAGCFDSLDPDRAKLMGNVEGILRYASERHTQKHDRQVSLFGAMEEKKSFIFEEESRWGPLEKLAHEFAALSFYLSAHPLDIYSNLDKIGATPSSRLEHTSDNTALRLIGVIITKVEKTSKTGQKYAFAQVSDQHGIFEIALFSEAYAKGRELLIPGEAVLVNVNLRLDGENYRLITQSITPLDQAMQLITKNLRIIVDETLSARHVEGVLASAGLGTTGIILQVRLVNAPYVEIFLPTRYNVTPEIRSKLLGTVGVLGIEDC